jgi:hypothetical protein
MPTLSSGDTLSLNALSYSNGTTSNGQQASVSAVVGGSPSAGDNISFSSFAVDGVDSISGYTYGVEETTETYTLNMTGAGTRWASTLGANSSNFTWAVDSGTTVTISASPTRTATITFSERGDNASQTAINTVAANTISCYYFEDYNDHASIGADNTETKTIYAVDSYDGNSSALCLTADSPIELADGEIIEAGDLEEGDILKGVNLNGLSEAPDGNFLRWDSETLGNESVDVNVINLTYSFASRYYDVNEGEITATAEHPMCVKDSESGLFKFKEIHQLVVGDKLIKGDGTEVEVTSVEAIEKTVEIVSIDVDGPDTYLANGYITHNKGGDTFSDFGGPGVPTNLAYNNPAGGGNSNISWDAPSSTGTEGITEYGLQVDNNSDFSSPESVHTGTYSTTSLNVSGLSTGTWYFRVRAKEMGVWGSYSDGFEFAHTFEN